MNIHDKAIAIILKTIPLLLFLTLLSCKQELVSYYYPNASLANRLHHGFVFHFDEFQSFAQLQDSMVHFHKHHQFEFPIFLIQEKNNNHYLAPEYTLGCFPPLTKYRNEFGISKDSVWKNHVTYAVKDLNTLLSKDLLNFNKDTLWSESPSKLRISFLDPDKETIADLKDHLVSVFRIYNQIEKNDSMELNIALSKTVILEPLPLE
jgi:hypothetical protein